MTFNEFKRQISEISRQQFAGSQFDPLEFGIERATFEERKLRRLIEVAVKTESATARKKISGWQRQIERVKNTRQRLQKAKLGVFPGVPETNSLPTPRRKLVHALLQK